MSFAAHDARRRRPVPAAEGRPRAGPGGPAGRHDVLRLRRDVCREKSRYIRRNVRRQGRGDPPVPRGSGHRGGQLLPDAYRRRAEPAAYGRARHAPGRDPGQHRGRVVTPPASPAPNGVMPTYLGMPSFPAAARTAVADSQLRRNLTHATTAIRLKRADAVSELDDWEELRQAA